ncbi:MAG: hypothetical protein IJP17_01330, partial [Clostridia bacterium]|nr:hypothetical protein [Clostridia bacterium]
RSESPFFLLFTCGAGYVFVRALREVSEDVCALWQIQKLSPRAICAAVFCALCVYSLVSLTVVSVKTARNYEQFTAREQYIEQQKESGNYDISLPPITPPEDRRIAYFKMYNSEPDYWVNIALRAYYGIDSIFFELE